MNYLPHFIVGLVVIFFVSCASFMWPLVSKRAQLRLNDANVPIAKLMAMKIRGHDMDTVTDVYISLMKAGAPVPLDHLEAHSAAGGDLPQCASAIIKSDKAGMPLPFDVIISVDLAGKPVGRGVLDMVETLVAPRTLICPPPGDVVPYIETATKDGVALRCRATVIVTTTADKYVGGTSQDELVAMICERVAVIVGKEGSSASVLSNPQLISEQLMKDNVDSGSMYEILRASISIWTEKAEQDVGGDRDEN